MTRVYLSHLNLPILVDMYLVTIKSRLINFKSWNLNDFYNNQNSPYKPLSPLSTLHVIYRFLHQEPTMYSTLAPQLKHCKNNQYTVPTGS